MQLASVSKLLTRTAVATDEGSSVALASLQTGEHRTLFAGSSARYVSTGHIVFFRSGDLLVDRFDLSRLQAAGTPVPIVHTVSGFLWSGVTHARYALSTSGRLVYRRGPVLPDVYKLVWVERDGRSIPFSESAGNYRYPRLSPNGQSLAVSDESEFGHNIWLHDLNRATRARVTFDGNSYISAWAPDSRRLAFQVSVPRGIYLKDVGETASATLLTEGCCSPSSWSPDGRFLLYVGRGDVRVHAVDGSDPPNPVAVSRFNEMAAVFSPDGRFIAFVSNESGRDEVYVLSGPRSQTHRLERRRNGACLVANRPRAFLPSARRNDDGGRRHGTRAEFGSAQPTLRARLRGHCVHGSQLRRQRGRPALHYG